MFGKGSRVIGTISAPAFKKTSFALLVRVKVISKSPSLGRIRPILFPSRKLLFKFTNPEKSKFEGILLVALSFGSLPEIV